MANPSHDLTKTEDTLKQVIQSLIDGQEGLQSIGKEIEDTKLREYFLGESLKRAEFRGDLEAILHQEGVHDVKEKGTALGTATTVWAGLKAKLGGGDHTLLSSAEEAEGEAVRAYEQATADPLPHPVNQLLLAQLHHIRASHEYIRAARDVRA